MSRKRVRGKSPKVFQDNLDDYLKPYTVKRMRPDNYFQESAKIHGGSVEKEFEMIDEPKLRKYIKLAQQGSKMPLPYLRYGEPGGQEGRHRVLVAKKMGKKTVPVIVINPDRRKK